MTGTEPAAYTRKQIRTALLRGTDLVDDIANASALLGKLERTTTRLLGSGKSFTYAEVSDALNKAADKLDVLQHDGWETGDTLWAQNVLNLAVNAVGHLLDHPDADLRDVIAEAHKDTELDVGAFDDLDENTPEPEPGSKAWNDALYKTVTGWIS